MVPGWLLFVLLVVMPLLELFVLIRIGQVIGGGATVLLLLLAAVLGAWVVRREGARAWAAFSQALAAGRMPTRELADGVLVLAGGVLMMAPGVVSDLIGLVMVLPFTRGLVRPLLVALAAPRLSAAAQGGPGFVGFGAPFGAPGAHHPGAQHPGEQAPHGGPRDGSDAPRPGPQDGGPVIRGEVVDE